MRNIERIDVFTSVLNYIWKSRCQDWRFTQLIENVYGSFGSWSWYMEDYKSLRALVEYFGMKDDKTLRALVECFGVDFDEIVGNNESLRCSVNNFAVDMAENSDAPEST